MTRRGRHARGFSLAEVLISMFFVTLLGVLMHQFHRTALRSLRLQETRGQAQETVRIAIEMMTRELRLGGYSAAGTPLQALRAAAADRVEIQCDLNGDGAVDDPDERITYGYNDERQTVTRATSGGSPQPLVDHVPPGAFELHYRDAAGVEIAVPLDAAARARVRRVEVSLRVEYPNPDPSVSNAIVARGATTIQLRNAR